LPAAKPGPDMARIARADAAAKAARLRVKVMNDPP
jgi:hypothetical protein